MSTLTKPTERVQLNREKLRARNHAIVDMKNLGYEFDFLRPCETSFNPKADGWIESKTTFYSMTRSVDALYIRAIGESISVRVIELSTGHFYYLKSNKRK